MVRNGRAGAAAQSQERPAVGGPAPQVSLEDFQQFACVACREVSTTLLPPSRIRDGARGFNIAAGFIGAVACHSLRHSSYSFPFSFLRLDSPPPLRRV
mmetsp:Transcript_33640/g.82723  ORF Transcript_33640/g.82723 Transcript_33640/m.82723 type:complete len:98 (-) Transcript_33640:101-394(-)